jgi:hypothetical protein
MAQFQSIIAAKLAQAAIPTTLYNLYIVPPTTQTYIKDFDICNTTGSPIQVSVYLVPYGGTAGAANAIMYSVSIPAYTMMQWTGTQILNVGDYIRVQASSAGCTINISGGQAV